MKTIAQVQSHEEAKKLQAKLRYSVIYGCKASGYFVMVPDADEESARKRLER